jgi:hypothetical protein
MEGSARSRNEREQRHRSYDESHHRETETVTQDEVHDVPLLRAQRHADADLLRTLGHWTG